MDLWLEETVPVSAFCPVHLSPRGSDHRRCRPTSAEFAAYSDKLFFVPENGIGRSLCLADSRSPEPGAKLELIFVGGLVPRKACYLALRAAAPLLRKDLAHFTLIGDGPERNSLEQLARALGIEKAVSFCGWLSHAEVLKRLRSADVVVLPAIREGGGRRSLRSSREWRRACDPGLGRARGYRAPGSGVQGPPHAMRKRWYHRWKGF